MENKIFAISEEYNDYFSRNSSREKFWWKRAKKLAAARVLTWEKKVEEK